MRPEIWEAKKDDGPWVDSDFYDWEGPCNYHIDVDEIAEADGICMLCPKCFDDAPMGPVGTHSIICWTPKISLDHDPKPGRWDLVGTSLDDLTLVAGSSSVALQGGCAAHFLVQQGSVVAC